MRHAVLLLLLLQVWEDGPVLRELASRKAALQRSREEVEVARKVGQQAAQQAFFATCSYNIKFFCAC
jgi:hypothetical protein